MMKRIGELNAERVHNLNQIGGLQAENARLQAEVERLTFDPLTYLDDGGEWMPRHTHLAAVARLKAEVERLKAGEQPTEWRHYKDEDTSK